MTLEQCIIGALVSLVCVFLAWQAITKDLEDRDDD